MKSIFSNVLVLCPDTQLPLGGNRQLYRIVDILNESGLVDATAVHLNRGFRYTWFEHQTKTAGLEEVDLQKEGSLLIVPEFWGYQMVHGVVDVGDHSGFVDRIFRRITGGRFPKGPMIDFTATPFVIFNQNCYSTFFHGYTIEDRSLKTPYSLPNIRGILVVSDDSQRYINLAFPSVPSFKVPCAIDPSLFRFSDNKKKVIALMPRKNQIDVVQVMNILKLRGALEGFKIVVIDKMSEREVARQLSEAMFFFSFGDPEGFGLPPAEAMSCGCVVVGYHGRGGREFFLEDFSFSVERGDIIHYVTLAEKVLGMARTDPESLMAMGKRASDYIQRTYSRHAQKEALLRAWDHLSPL